jgi:hypothetical protein
VTLRVGNRCMQTTVTFRSRAMKLGTRSVYP